MRAQRIAIAAAAGATFAWGALVACGSDRPPPADLNPVRAEGGSTSPGSEAGSFGEPGAPCVDINPTRPLPSLGFGVEVTLADASNDCFCRAVQRDGLAVKLPCASALCFGGVDQMWDCSDAGIMRAYEGNGIGTTCDASTFPTDAGPCPSPR